MQAIANGAMDMSQWVHDDGVELVEEADHGRGPLADDSAGDAEQQGEEDNAQRIWGTGRERAKRVGQQGLDDVLLEDVAGAALLGAGQFSKAGRLGTAGAGFALLLTEPSEV